VGVVVVRAAAREVSVVVEGAEGEAAPTAAGDVGEERGGGGARVEEGDGKAGLDKKSKLNRG